MLNELIAKVLRTYPKPVKLIDGYHSVDYDAAALYDFLQQQLQDLLPVVESSANMFLRGFFDAEGYATQSTSHDSKTPGSVRVGAANCVLDYLRLVQQLLLTLGIPSTLRRTNKAGQQMTVRGKTYSRRREVYHVEIVPLRQVITFRNQIDFVPQKKQKLQDLTNITTTLDPRGRYEWFTAHYERHGDKWVRKTSLK